MANIASDLLEKIRQQFDNSPYPRVPVEHSPQNSLKQLYIHNLVTSYYLTYQKVIDTKDKLILDVGCGSGWKSLILASANPGAKIVGTDISAESIKLARQRLAYHGFNHAEFHVLSIQDLSKLDYQFDYINCDELLYLLPESAEALQAMKAVLKPQGIIRSNLHSSIQRFNIYRAQKIFTIMGLMDSNPEELEMGIAVETMQALQDGVNLKDVINSSFYEGENSQEWILMNFLFQGDKGYTIADMFNALRKANLEFISMVNWREWNLMDLFKEPDNLPTFLAMSLPEISLEEGLQLFELLHPVHRLLDFWCCHPNQRHPILSPEEWSDYNWSTAKVYLHPQVQTNKFREDLITCIREVKNFPISQYLPIAPKFVTLDTTTAMILVALLDQPQSLESLVERWKQLRPTDPITLIPIDNQQAREMMQKLLIKLEFLGCVMLESQAVAAV